MGHNVNIGAVPQNPKITPFRAEDYLTSPEARAAYLLEAGSTGDKEFIADAKRIVANAEREAPRKRA